MRLLRSAWVRGVTFPSRRAHGAPEVKLGDIFDVLGINPDAFRWTVTGLELAGSPPSLAKLEELSDPSREFSPSTLRWLADPDVQIIDGTLAAYLPGHGEPKLKIRAADSTYWDVETDDFAVLDRIRTRITGVEDIPVD
jgi:hypothetical protein